MGGGGIHQIANDVYAVNLAVVTGRKAFCSTEILIASKAWQRQHISETSKDSFRERVEFENFKFELKIFIEFSEKIKNFSEKDKNWDKKIYLIWDGQNH